mmetsp:Transcript_1619/g.1434  ORF Transcript_1619/g.1434 Transcript_1619/m.1434 type:complete len:116 (+) Transcript_1619:1674-2021(+)
MMMIVINFLITICLWVSKCKFKANKDREKTVPRRSIQKDRVYKINQRKMKTPQHPENSVSDISRANLNPIKPPIFNFINEPNSQKPKPNQHLREARNYSKNIRASRIYMRNPDIF